MAGSPLCEKDFIHIFNHALTQHYASPSMQLGEGAFSTVKLCTHKSAPSNAYAVKIVDKTILNEDDTAALLVEVEILFSLKTAPHIIRLYDFFDEPKEYFLVMETMGGGELFDRIVKKSFYNEREARCVCKILLEAIAYCHDARVVRFCLYIMFEFIFRLARFFCSDMDTLFPLSYRLIVIVSHSVHE